LRSLDLWPIQFLSRSGWKKPTTLQPIHYDHPRFPFWDRFGSGTVERLPLAPGMNVLDVCCGIGGSALPAAVRSAKAGRVVAVDLAQISWTKEPSGPRSAACQTYNSRADLEDLPFADQSFDAVMCVFGIFFVGFTRRSPRVVAPCPPSGFLAITIWGAKMFRAADDKFWEAVRQEDPELFKSIKPWNKIVLPDPLRALLVECG